MQGKVRELKREEQTPKVKKAVARLTKAMSEIRSACGPTMIVPLPEL